LGNARVGSNPAAVEPFFTWQSDFYSGDSGIGIFILMKEIVV
jgi:hypothetical protein